MNILEALSELVKFPLDNSLNHSKELLTSTAKKRTISIDKEKENSKIDNKIDDSNEISMIDIKTEDTIDIKDEPIIDIHPKCNNTKRNSQRLSLKRSSKSSNSNLNDKSVEAKTTVEFIDCTENETNVENKSKDERFISMMINGKPRSRCRMCGKNFDPNDFDDHFQNKHESLKYNCDICKKDYVSLFALRKHQHSTHKNNHKTCHHCNKTYTNKRGLAVHIEAIHMKTAKWKCKLCGKAFNRKDALKLHRKIHSKVRDLFVCQMCKKEFKRRSSLIYHERSNHTGIRNFKCRFCDKAFFQNSDLTRHTNSKHKNLKFPKHEETDS